MHKKPHDQFSAIGALECSRAENLDAADQRAKDAGEADANAAKLRSQEACLRERAAEQGRAIKVLRDAGFAGGFRPDESGWAEACLLILKCPVPGQAPANG